MPIVRRGLVLLLAYLVSALVSSVAVVVYSGVQQGAVVWTDQLKIILPVVLVLGLPVAWVPLTFALWLARRLWRSQLVATFAACAFTAFVLLVWQGSLVNNVLSVDVSPTDPPLWRLILQALPAVAIVGLLGGLAFWAIAYRGTSAARSSSPV